MNQNSCTLGVCIYNEEKTVLKHLNNIKRGLDKIFGQGNFELLVIENGSTDNTLGLLKTLTFKELKVISAPRKGHGLALRLAIENAQYDRVGLLGLDLPFGFDDLKKSLTIWDRYDLIFGSKAHPDSKVIVPLKRMIASFVLRIILKVIFKSNIRDSQGTFFLKKKAVLPILKHCDSETAFFSAQLSIYGTLYRLRVAEIPVKMIDTKTDRPSKYSVFRDGSKMLYDIYKEYKKFKRIGESLILKSQLLKEPNHT